MHQSFQSLSANVAGQIGGAICDASQQRTESTPKKENPDALAGAIGAVSNELAFKSEEYRNRLDAARALCLVIAICDPDDAVQIMAAAVADLSAGQPIPPLVSFMSEAAHWADLASAPELKAYCLASFTRLPCADQRAFLAYAGRVAA